VRMHRPCWSNGPALAAVLALSGAVLTGCAGVDDGASAPQLETEVPDVRGAEDPDDPYRGLLDARFAEDLPAYFGQEVTVHAAVADVLSPRVFTVTSPEGDEVEPLLVVATAGAGAEPSTGEELVIAATPTDEFDAEAVVEDLDLDIDPAELEEWDDEAYLVATELEPAP
jgi:hypothetical protein